LTLGRNGLNLQYENNIHFRNSHELVEVRSKMTPVNKHADVDETFVKEKEAAFADFIKRKGLKTTRQRNTIISTFFRLRGHISVEELLNEVKKANPRIGYATVYRTLHLLVASNLVEERRFGDGMARYEGHSDVEHHDHMICLECGEIFEFFNPRLEALQEKLAEENNFKIYRHRLELYGACQDLESCERRKKDRASEARGG
jgi:Fur family ferric uptake transcriptional regulator